MRDPIPVYIHLRRAKDLIDRDFAEPLDVRALAREAHASRAHFVRSFKKAFGESPHQYLLRRRIERAKEFLRNTPLSVTEVSLAVGFPSLGSFSTAFRQLVGESPSTYAHRWRPADPPPIPACFTLNAMKAGLSGWQTRCRLGVATRGGLDGVVGGRGSEPQAVGLGGAVG